jgi:hypothetical protein
MNEQVLAYERGIDDAFFQGIERPPEEAELRDAYKAGYDHGIWMYRAMIDGEVEP